MNVKKNPFYYINTVIFLILSVYSLLFCINIFDTENIDMNAGLCAVIVSMVLCLIMYLIHVTRVRNMLAANPILKTSLEVISVLIFLTLSCVVRIYLMGEFELDITREGIVLLCMFMAYLTARMLNQYGFVTLMILVPWPYLISTYNYDLQELIQVAAVIAGLCVLSVILFAVRKKRGLRLAAMVLFLIAAAAYFFYGIYQAGLTSAYMEDYRQYIECFNKMFQFTQFEKYYYIAAVMAAIIGGIRLFLGSGSADTLILFIVNVICFLTIQFDLGPAYLYLMYPLLAIAAAGSLGTRPSYEDEEVQLQDNLENVQVKYNKKDVVGLSYVDDSELDRMLEDIEKEHKYIPHKNLSELSEANDEDIPVELKVYDSALSVIEDEKQNAVSNPEPVATAPVYEPVTPVKTPIPEPEAQVPVYEPVTPVMTPVPEPVTPVPEYETAAFDPQPVYESVMTVPVYETLETKPEEPKQPEPLSYEPEHRYEEETPAYEPEYRYEEETPAYEPEYRYEEETPAYEPEYRYEEETPAYEPEYRYEEEKTVTHQTMQASYFEPEPIEELVVESEQAAEPFVPEPVFEPATAAPVYETVEKEPEEPKQQPYETISYNEPVFENFVQEEPQNLQPQLLIKNPVSFDNERDSEASGNSVDYGFIQSKPMFETMASFFSNNLDVDNAPKFEMSQQDAKSFDAYSAAGEIYTPIDSMDELFTNADAGLEFEEIEPQQQAEKPYNEDDELVEEPVSVYQTIIDDFGDAIAPVVLDKPTEEDDEIIEEPVIIREEPQQSVVIPDNVELGLDLEEEFSFGQTMSFTDLYDTDNTSVFTEFEEIEETPETTVAETIVELPETEELIVELPETEEFSVAPAAVEPKITAPIVETLVMEAPEMEEFTPPIMEEPVTEEFMAPIADVPVADVPIVEESAVLEFTPPAETVPMPKEPVVEPVFVQPEAEKQSEALPAVPVAEELYAEPVVEKKEKEPVKQVNPFAKEDDFFDWSTYDGSVDEEPEPIEEEAHSMPVKTQTADDFEEFVWTDEMIKQFSDGGNVTAPQEEPMQVEDSVSEVIEEIAATAVPESFFEPEAVVKAEEPLIQQVLVEKPIVQEVQIETPVREVSSAVSVSEELEEEETPQYQVYQSSGNFRLEEPEEQEEEMPQYQVYQSSGNFQLEEEEEEPEPILVTYGGPQQQKTEPVTAKTEEKPTVGNKFGDFEFDLDLPDFEPFNPTKR